MHNRYDGLSATEVDAIARIVMIRLAGIKQENIIISDNVQNNYPIEPIEIIIVTGDQ